MVHFFFHFRQGPQLSRDEEGSDFASLEDAYLDVHRAIQEMWEELLSARCDPRDCAFEICDESGLLLMTVPFTEVLDSCVRRHAGPPARTRPDYSEVATTIDRSVRLRSEVSESFRQTQDALDRIKAQLGPGPSSGSRWRRAPQP
ncbi:DUF6894 family protein [Amorphus sp. MBR-141]